MSDDTSQILQACPSCATLLDVTDEAPFSQTYCPSCGQSIRARSQFNNFQLIEILGEGGMGSVFKAVDQNLHRLVALKILKKEHCTNAEERKRLETEARLTASINHPHVVKLYSFGQDHGQFYMAMELVEKGSLDDLIGIQQRVSEVQVLHVGIQIAQGLEAALERGLIHRDIKPGNILFKDANTAKIVDFGLAAPISDKPGDEEIWGTPYYIAPEKLNNEPEDFRSDIYSLGGTLFHALAGRPPFEAQTASMVALKHIKNQAVSLQAFAPDVSSETAYVINRMLAKDPNDRYASYADLIEHLQYAHVKILEKAGTKHRHSQRVVVESQRQQQFIGLLTLLLLLIIGASLFIFRDAIFKNLNALKPPVQEQVVSQETVQADFKKARQGILAGDYGIALSSLLDLAKASIITPPTTFWIQLNAALAAMLDGQNEIALQIFQELRQEGFYSTTEDHRELASFFYNMGVSLSEDRAISLAATSYYSANTFEVFGLLLIGINNWNLGQLDDAFPFLNAYAQATPAKLNPPWIMDYKPLAESFLSDYKTYRDLRDRVAKVSEASTATQVLHDLQSTRKTLRSGHQIQEQFDQLERELVEKRTSLDFH